MQTRCWMAAIALLFVAQPAAADDDTFFFLVRADQLACISRHIDAYLATDDEILYIDPEDCPPAKAANFANALRNEAPDIAFAEANEYDPVWVVVRDQLLCLKGYTPPVNATVLRFYPETCNVEAE